MHSWDDKDYEEPREVHWQDGLLLENASCCSAAEPKGVSDKQKEWKKSSPLTIDDSGVLKPEQYKYRIVRDFNNERTRCYYGLNQANEIIDLLNRKEQG